MATLFRFLAFLLLLTFCKAPHAECRLPPPPSKLPAGATSTDEEMSRAMATMSDYEADVNNYLKCLAFEVRQGRMAESEQTRLSATALETHQTIVTRFNAEMKIYMAR